MPACLLNRLIWVLVLVLPTGTILAQNNETESEQSKIETSENAPLTVSYQFPRPQKPTDAARWLAWVAPVAFTASFTGEAIDNPAIKDRVKPSKEGTFSADLNTFVTDLGSGTYALPIIAYLAFYYPHPKGNRDMIRQRIGSYHHESMLLLMRTIIWGTIAVQALKVSVGRSRPFVKAKGQGFKTFTFDSNFHSYPSGHTFTSFALAAVVTLRYGYAWVAIPLAGYAAYTRVLLKKHYFTDIFFSAVFTLSLTYLLDSRLLQKETGIVFFSDAYVQVQQTAPVKRSRNFVGLDVVYYMSFVKMPLEKLQAYL